MEESGTFINIEGRSQSSVRSSTSSKAVISFVSDFMPLLIMAAGLKTQLPFGSEDINTVSSEPSIGSTVPSISSLSNLS